MDDDLEEHTPTEVSGPGLTDEVFNWCSWCGDLWKPTSPWCQCHPDSLRQFPDHLTEAVAATRRIVGHEGVWEIEKALWRAQPHPVRRHIRDKQWDDVE